MGLGVTRRGVEYIHSYSLHKVIGWVGLGWVGGRSDRGISRFDQCTQIITTCWLLFVCQLQLKFGSKSWLRNTTSSRYRSFFEIFICHSIWIYSQISLNLILFFQASGKLESFIEKKRRKNAAKDHRYMPYRRSNEGGQ